MPENNPLKDVDPRWLFAFFKIAEKAKKDGKVMIDLREVDELVSILDNKSVALTLSANQLRDALSFCNPDSSDVEQRETEVTFFYRLQDEKGFEGDLLPAGWYCFLTEYPEEGCYGPLGVDPVCHGDTTKDNYDKDKQERAESLEKQARQAFADTGIQVTRWHPANTNKE